jgi:hypothetical protein
MIQSALIVVALVVVGAYSLPPAAAQPTTPVMDPFGPTPEECQVEPRSMDELQAILGNGAARPTPLAVEATPGRLDAVELPDGVPADAATVEEITTTARQVVACRNAGDIARSLAPYSANAIHHDPVLFRLTTALAAGELSTASPEPYPKGQRLHFAGLFHARVLPDGRVAAVASSGMTGLPELYVFVRDGDRWLIDARAPLTGPHAEAGVVGTTFTGEYPVVDVDRAAVGGYGFGLEWSPEWAAMVTPEIATTPGIVALTNGISLVVLGVPLADPGSDLAACVTPLPEDLAADVASLVLDDAAIGLAEEMVPVVDAAGHAVQGDDAQRAFAVYESGNRTGGSAAAVEPYRLYLECRVMAGGGWVLRMMHLVPAAAYEVEETKRDQLLASIEG